MPDRAMLVRLGKLVAAEIAAGQAGPDSLASFEYLEAEPEAVLDLIDLILAEARKKRPSDQRMTAYAAMIGQSLEFTRFGIEAGDADAATLVETVRQRLLALGREEQAGPVLLLLILRAFAKAKLDIGPALRELTGNLAEQASASAPAGMDLKAVEMPLADLIREIGDNPFEIHANLGEIAEAFPDDHRAAFVAGLLESREEPAREAALGWLLDPSASVRNATAAGIERTVGAGGVSGVMLRRLIALRTWLPEADRAPLDRAIEACHSAGVQAAPWPEPRIREAIASGVDGAGVQSIFIPAREGRRNAVASLLLKQGIGVRDAWARHGLTRAELDDFLEPLDEIGPVPVSPDFLRIAFAHALAVNLVKGVLPPFTLLDAVETGDLHAVQPALLSSDAVLGLLEAGAGPVPSQTGETERLLASGDLLDRFPFLNSWFESDSEVEQLLAGRPLARGAQIALVQDELLPRRAAKWLERLAWTALLLRHAQAEEPWQEFFAAANELKSGRRIAEIPLMTLVASLTVDAYAASRRQHRGLRGKKRRSGPRSTTLI